MPPGTSSGRLVLTLGSYGISGLQRLLAFFGHLRLLGLGAWTPKPGFGDVFGLSRV